MSFLEVLLGDEPVLSPQAHFYQRLLAQDDDEARDITEKYLKEKPLGDLYDSVLIPALSLAEKDRHANVLDESRTEFILQTTRELIEELYEEASEEVHERDDSSLKEPPQAPRAVKVVCIPARDDADEIVGTMAVQLLRRAGHNADSLPICSVSTMLEWAEQLQPDVICVSALPPFAVMHAKSLCKQLRRQCPNAKILLGLWEFAGGLVKAQERVGSSCADMIGTSLAQILSLIGGGTNSRQIESPLP